MTEIGGTTAPGAELVEALDRALTSVPRSAVISPEIAALVDIAARLQLSTENVRPTAAYRAAARERLMARIASASALPRQEHGNDGGWRERAARWALRVIAALTALSCAGAAASASANALPGDALYIVKQVQEKAVLQAAPNDSARQMVLLDQAGRRLDETGRLLDQGRGADANATLARYDQTLATAAQAEIPSTNEMRTQLQRDKERLDELVKIAPAPARAGLEQALQKTQRQLAGSSQIPPADEKWNSSPQARYATNNNTPANAKPEHIARPVAISTPVRSPQAADAHERGVGAADARAAEVRNNSHVEAQADRPTDVNDTPSPHAEAPGRVGAESQSPSNREAAPADNTELNGASALRATSHAGAQPPHERIAAPDSSSGHPAPGLQPPGRSRR